MSLAFLTGVIQNSVELNRALQYRMGERLSFNFFSYEFFLVLSMLFFENGSSFWKLKFFSTFYMHQKASYLRDNDLETC